MYTLKQDELSNFHKYQQKYLKQLRKHPAKAETLKRLQESSGQFMLKAEDEKLSFIAGERIGGIRIHQAAEPESLESLVGKYFDQFGALYGFEAQRPAALKVGRVKQGSQTTIKVQQYLHEIPVVDAQFTVIFDERGDLQQVTGRPFTPDELGVEVTPAISQYVAIQAALEHLEKELDTSRPPIREDQFQIDYRLGIIGKQRRLVWLLQLNSLVEIGFSRDAQVDAHTGEIVIFEQIVVDGTRGIPVTRYRHPGGVLNSTGDTETVDINVNTEERWSPRYLPFFLRERRYSLQRLGSGRARIWNAQYNGTTHPPSFTRTWTDWENIFSPRYWSTTLFTQAPGGHTSKIFNEQQTYYYSQLLKTYVDQWGRRPNSYGHYPVNEDRAVNVDIIVNADESMELTWATVGVLHGGFAQAVSTTWFEDYPEAKASAPTVYLFNSPGNSGSPQFFGPEDSSSYSIVAHEVGHFISWTYGYWNGPAGTSLRGSLNEGFSMVFPALVGKKRWPALAYTDSMEVTTGSFIGGSQWSHHVPGTPELKYSNLSCTDNKYYLAWPFTQAMWNLIHNQDKNGDAIWATQEAALNNTADLFMYALYHYTEDSTMTWDKLAVGMIVYMWLHFRGQQGELPQSLVRVWDVFDAHGLLEGCT